MQSQINVVLNPLVHSNKKNIKSTKNYFENEENKLMQRENLIFKSYIRKNKLLLKDKIIIHSKHEIYFMSK